MRPFTFRTSEFMLVATNGDVRKVTENVLQGPWTRTMSTLFSFPLFNFWFFIVKRVGRWGGRRIDFHWVVWILRLVYIESPQYNKNIWGERTRQARVIRRFERGEKNKNKNKNKKQTSFLPSWLQVWWVIQTRTNMRVQWQQLFGVRDFIFTRQETCSCCFFDSISLLTFFSHFGC